MQEFHTIIHGNHINSNDFLSILSEKLGYLTISGGRWSIVKWTQSDEQWLVNTGVHPRRLPATILTKFQCMPERDNKRGMKFVSTNKL